MTPGSRRDSSRIWIPPRPSTGVRQPRKQSKGSFHGAAVGADNRELLSESDLERKVALWLESRHDVVRVRDQWPAVPYYVDGKRHVHTFDFHVEMANGSCRAVPVRPAAQVKSLLPVLRLIVKQGTLAAFAESISLVTDNDVTEDVASNASNIVRARKVRDDRELHAARADVSGIYGSVRFNDLVRKAEHPALRRSALWCLVGEGFLVAENPRERITDATVMRVNRASH